MKISMVSIEKKAVLDVSYDGFYNELLNHVICPKEQKEIGKPIQCNNETKESIKRFFESLNIGNEKNSVIAFFNRIPENMCYYIIPIELNEDSMDELQNKLYFYNEQYDDQYVEEKMKPFYENINRIKKECKFLYDNYIGTYYKFSKVQKFGEPDRKKRKCIYCGKTEQEGVTFKMKAHAIPDALGNNKLFQNEECDECNVFFGNGIEKEFIEFIGIVRTLGGISGKKNDIPIYSNHGVKISYDEKSTNEKIKVESQNEKKNTNVTECTYIRIDTLYRVLCRMVLGVIEPQYRIDFLDTIKWVRYNKLPDEINSTEYMLPIVAVRMEEEILKEPEITIFVRNNDNKDIPYCISSLRIANLDFVYVLPFTNKDNGFISKDKFFDFFNQTMFSKHTFMFTNQNNFAMLSLGKMISINNEKNN